MKENGRGFAPCTEVRIFGHLTLQAMKSFIQRWIDDLLMHLGLTSAQADVTDQWAAFAVVLLIAVLVAWVCRYVLLRVVRRIVRQTRVTWDDIIFNDRVLKRFSHLLIPLILYIMLPAIFPTESGARHVMVRLTQVYIVVAILRLLSTLIRAVFDIAANRRAWQGKPIKGLRQTGQGIVYLIGAILIVSILMNRSPAILLTSLGASAAILMLIFRDSILGFVSGIQLSANDMLKVGDWIAMPKYGADGTVEEVSLTTVKIRNWDNTIVTLPPYLLVSDSFQNWEGMRASGGRRVKRSVNIDMASVRFCNSEMLDRYRGIALLRDYIEQTERRVEAYNAAHGIPPERSGADGMHQTNLGVFRAYLVNYLRDLETVNKKMTLMVRQLQPTETGLPMELYFFTNTVEWVAYEGIQSDVFDHVLAVVPTFDLRVFQNPSGSDVERLARRTPPQRNT